MTEDTQLIYLLQFDIKSPSVISLATRSSTPQPPISSITWRWGSSCRVFCSCVLPQEHMLHKSDFRPPLKMHDLFWRKKNKKQSDKPWRRITTSASVLEIYNSLWQMSKTECVYFSRTVTTRCKYTTEDRRQMSLHPAAYDLCAAHDLIISKRCHRGDDLIMISKSPALETFHCDGGRKTHQTVHKALLACLYPTKAF